MERDLRTPADRPEGRSVNNEHRQRRTAHRIGAWRTSSFSNQGTCVELAPTSQGVVMRNSNDHQQGTLTFSRADFAEFLEWGKAGALDDLAN
jgi:hypothetical protein